MGGNATRHGFIEHPGDAEVQQPHTSAVVDENVGRFQVAVDDHAGMRIADRIAYLAEQAEPRRQIGGVIAAPDIDRLAIDVLHRHVRTLVGRDAAVDQAGDARMLKTRKEPALAIEELRQSSCLRAQHLERNALLEALVFPVRGVHLAHTTASDQAIDDEST